MKSSFERSTSIKSAKPPDITNVTPTLGPTAPKHLVLEPKTINLAKYSSVFNHSGTGAYVTPGRLLRRYKYHRKKQEKQRRSWTHLPGAICEQVVHDYHSELMTGVDESFRFGKIRQLLGTGVSTRGVWSEREALVTSLLLPQRVLDNWGYHSNPEEVCEYLCVVARGLFPRKIRVRCLRALCADYNGDEDYSSSFLALARCASLAKKVCKAGSEEYNYYLSLWATHLPRFAHMFFHKGDDLFNYSPEPLRMPFVMTRKIRGGKSFYTKGKLAWKVPCQYKWDEYDYFSRVSTMDATTIQPANIT